jgi:hypothetical protein
MPLDSREGRTLRQRNRRMGWIIVASLLVLYLLAIGGVLGLN